MTASRPALKPLPPEAHRVRTWRGDAPLHLVGGAVRDWLLGRTIHDLDFVLPHGAVDFGREVARRLRAAFFVLDARRDVARVILPAAEGRTVRMLDFAAYRGPDLETDLRRRDFTVNALAVDPAEPLRLVDPTGGLRDLKDRVLRLAYPQALHDDPLRVLRAVRLAIVLDFRISPETRAALPEAAPGLKRVAAERIGEEWFRLLDHPRVGGGLRVLRRVRALAFVASELDALYAFSRPAWERALRAGGNLHLLARALAPDYRPEHAANFALGLVSWRLGRYRRHLAEHWGFTLHPHRPARALAVWAALYHSVGQATGADAAHEQAAASARLAAQRARALRLSRAEIRRLRRTIEHYPYVLAWAESANPPDARAVHRFFRSAGPAGVDAVLVALAVALARGDSLAPSHALWERLVEVARVVLEAWWERHDQIVAPPPLLRGDEVTALVGRPPGPWVGRALQALAEAQAAGEVSTREQAETWVREWARTHTSAGENGYQGAPAGSR